MNPIIKYVGGKSSLMHEIQPYITKASATSIYEPFVGSGAVSLLSGLPMMWNDNQPELINFYRVVISYPNRLIEKLASMAEYHNELFNTDRATAEEFYLLTRSQNPETSLLRAARYFYIIYTGFNGLYRVNKKGENQCNTAFGKKVFSFNQSKVDDILRFSDYLKVNLKYLTHGQFDSTDHTCIETDSNPFVFIDPPYAKKDNGKAIYTEYTEDKIGDAFWDRLLAYMLKLDSDGIPFLMTNTYCKFIAEKFGMFNTRRVATKYNVQAKGSVPIAHEYFISNIDL